MLEKILDTIVTAETYTVRIIDEGIHAAVNKTVRNVEKKGLPRDAQALVLSSFSGVGGQLYGLVQFFHMLVDGRSMDYPVPAHMWFTGIKRMMYQVLALDLANFDLDSIKHGTGLAQKGGTLANDGVFSYQSLSGIIRPYVLGISVALLAHGIVERNMEHVQYGLLSLPYALSLYVRDDQSGGLLERIKMSIKSFIAKPAEQALTANSYEPLQMKQS